MLSGCTSGCSWMLLECNLGLLDCESGWQYLNILLPVERYEVTVGVNGVKLAVYLPLLLIVMCYSTSYCIGVGFNGIDDCFYSLRCGELFGAFSSALFHHPGCNFLIQSSVCILCWLSVVHTHTGLLLNGCSFCLIGAAT